MWLASPVAVCELTRLLPLIVLSMPSLLTVDGFVLMLLLLVFLHPFENGCF